MKKENETINSPSVKEGRITINKSGLERLVKESVRKYLGLNPLVLKEVKKEKSDPSATTGPYASKVDSLVSDTIDRIVELVEEGEALIRENPTHDYEVQERNHAVVARVGILKNLKSKLVDLTEYLHRNV